MIYILDLVVPEEKKETALVRLKSGNEIPEEVSFKHFYLTDERTFCDS